ncbi:MAG TPA: DEAD/DEAH box helicase family protein [Microbacteriaceae bacterium]
MSSNFDFLAEQWPAAAFEARAAEKKALTESREALFRARRAIEAIVGWMYTADTSLNEPYKRDLSARLHEPSFQAVVDPGIRQKFNVIRIQGNTAVHKLGFIKPEDGLKVIRELYFVCVWFATRYADVSTTVPDAGTPFDALLIPRTTDGGAKTLAQLKTLAADLAAKDKSLESERQKRADAEKQVKTLQAQVTELIAANATAAKYTTELIEAGTEAETRTYLIDVMLHEAGWPLAEARDREYEVAGQPTPSGRGFVDYVLWGDDGKALGIVEAKKTTASPAAGQHQARLYAEALEQETGQLPVIFYTNGYTTWLWDSHNYPPRKVDGFYTKEQLQLLVQRRTSRHPLGTVATNTAIAGRGYQEHAIRSVTDVFEANQRKALLVMATGTGKTRTAIALVDVLMRANWAKNVLFLADRTALVKQAADAFTSLLPSASTVNLLKNPDGTGRVYAATYQTMMHLIDTGDELRRFGPGFFDLVIVDEAHRSIYQKFGEIFEYFDALLLGLTATPKAEVDHNTYRLFELEDGVPTDEYPLDKAIADGYLVPPRARPIGLGFMRSGIRYDDLSDAEREEWDELEWGDDGEIPDEVPAAEINRWLFNADTVDKVLEILMTEGRRVAGGDVLGKTIVFARNVAHASSFSNAST